MMKTTIKLMIIGLTLTVGVFSATAQTNVLLIIADDLGIDSLAAFNTDPNASLPPTPTIDGIKAEGITFTRFYSYSTCSPTRAAILTGRYSFRTGVFSPEEGVLQPNEFTLAEALIESGVISNRLAHIGKWHLGRGANTPNSRGGWPHFSGALGGDVSDFYSWSKTVNGTTTANHDVYATTDNVNDSLAWINEQGTNSWFLWLAFNAPHTPLHRPPNDLHDYDTLSDDGANGSRPHFEAMVQALDTELARLLSQVDLSTTTIIFMGDNGTSRGVIQPPYVNTHGKGSPYEGGIRVPLLIYGGIVDNSLAGTTYDGSLHSTDLYATILELFGVDAADVVPEELVLDSRSFAPVLRGESYIRAPTDIMVRTQGSTASASSITEGDYKYIDFDDGTEAFYNVTLDLPEENNLLAGNLSSAEQLALESLQEKLTNYYSIPRIQTAYFDESDGFTTKLGWFHNEGFTLWRSENLLSNDWAEVPAQTLEDNGESTLILRDSAPPTLNAFYRVTTP